MERHQKKLNDNNNSKVVPMNAFSARVYRAAA